MRYPELGLICAHLGGGLPFFGHMPEVADLCRRLYFDTAAAPLLYQASAYRTVVDLCGADRMLLGSDHPLLEVGDYLAGLDSVGLSGAERAAITGDNAARVLGL
jgi:predicted TIM-barrel fold metal-dependent hydrolase